MVKRYLRAAAAIGLVVGLAGGAAARPFTARDLASIERISSPRVSADGRFVAYVQRTTDWDANRGVNALHIIDLQGDASKPLVLVSGEKGSPSPSWSHDGKWLYFLSGKSGSQQLWRARADGSVRRQLTAFPVDVAAYRVGPDERTLVLAVDTYPDCQTLACNKDRDDAKAKEKASGIHIKSGISRFWDSYEDEKYLSLFRVDLAQQGAPAEAARIVRDFAADVPSDGDIGEMAVSHDGRTVYFSSRNPAEELGSQAFVSLYSVPYDGSAAPRVVIGKTGTSYGSPAVSPDGTRLAYLAVAQAVNTYGRTAIMIRDLRTGQASEVAPNFDASLRRLDWSADGKSLLAVGDERGQAPLYRIDPVSGQVARFTSAGVVSDFDAARGTVAFVNENLETPQQLFVQQGSSPARQLTHAGATILAEAPMSRAEQFSFPGWNGETVYGYVMKPAGFVEGRKYPVAFLIHGGPHGNFGNSWSYRWNPQVWAGMGYAVVTVDFHGSAGYGESFGRAIIGHWGDRPLEDLQKGWASALSRYAYLDGNRACALGGSYGGYMVAWIAGRWNEPWRCLVDHAGIFDVRSMAWSMDSSSFIDVQFGSAPNISDWERFNPSAFAGNWKKPILVIHGGKDFRVPTEQGIEAHNAARRAGVPTELLIFPDENHWVLKPQNSVQWYDVVQKWMDRWTAPASASQAQAAIKAPR